MEEWKQIDRNEPRKDPNNLELYVPKMDAIPAYHVTLDSLCHIAMVFRGIVDYQSYSDPFVKFHLDPDKKAWAKAIVGDTIFKDPSKDAWEIMPTWQFDQQYRIASPGEIR